MLTDDDKQWFKQELQRFATKTDLERFATKADLERFATKVELERFATKEDMERVETSLLTEFHKWPSPIDQRMRSHREAIRSLDIEGEQMSDAIKRIETRLKQLEAGSGQA